MDVDGEHVVGNYYGDSAAVSDPNSGGIDECTYIRTYAGDIDC